MLDTLVPEVFLDFSPLEMREPRSGDRSMLRYYESQLVISLYRSPLRGSLISAEKNQEKPLGPGYVLDDVASELFSVLSQLSDHCVVSRKLIAHKIKKKLEIYFWSVQDD